MSSLGSSLLDHFAALRDPRQSWKVAHPLPEILVTVPSGTLAGAEGIVETRRRALPHLDVLRRFLPSATWPASKPPSAEQRDARQAMAMTAASGASTASGG